MLFVFGSPRSGTTLLAQCLNAHPDIVVPDETDFIIPAAFVFDRIPDPVVRREILKKLIVSSPRFPFSLGEFLTAAQAHDIVERHADRPDELYEHLYGAVADRASAKMAGDKSPNDLFFLRIVIKVGGIGPDAKIVHIVRDVRDVVHSLGLTNFNNAAELWFPRQWSASNLYLHDHFSRSAQYLLVRYEDFVRAPEPMMQRVCAHLHVEYDPLMLDPTRRHPRYRSAAHHRKLYQPISDQFIGAYRTALSASVIARCEEQAAEALRVFGYQT